MFPVKDLKTDFSSSGPDLRSSLVVWGASSFIFSFLSFLFGKGGNVLSTNSSSNYGISGSSSSSRIVSKASESEISMSSTSGVTIFSTYVGFLFEISDFCFFVPRTVASLRSARSARSCPLSTVLGPPCA